VLLASILDCAVGETAEMVVAGGDAVAVFGTGVEVVSLIG